MTVAFVYVILKDSDNDHTFFSFNLKKIINLVEYLAVVGGKELLVLV